VPARPIVRPGEEPSFFATLVALVGDISTLAIGPERRGLWLALGLAFFDQVRDPDHRTRSMLRQVRGL
jgi:hypothetical protein